MDKHSVLKGRHAALTVFLYVMNFQIRPSYVTATDSTAFLVAVVDKLPLQRTVYTLRVASFHSGNRLCTNDPLRDVEATLQQPIKG